MKTRRAFTRCAVLLLIPAVLQGCQHVDALLHPVPPARTTPPQAFDESASFGWMIWWGMSHDYLAPRSQEMDKQGLRPQNLEVYKDEGDTRYACIYLRDARAWQARWHYDRAGFDREFRILRDKGYRPIDLEIYGIDDKTRYAYVMIHDPDNSDWEAVWGKTADGMEAEFNRLVRQGYRMTSIEASYPQGELRLSGIFVKDREPTEWRWTASRSGGQIRSEIDELGDRFCPVHMAIAPHKEGGLVRIIIWRRN